MPADHAAALARYTGGGFCWEFGPTVGRVATVSTPIDEHGKMIVSGAVDEIGKDDLRPSVAIEILDQTASSPPLKVKIRRGPLTLQLASRRSFQTHLLRQQKRSEAVDGVLVINEAVGIFVGTVIVVDHEFRITVAIEIKPVDELQITSLGDEQVLAGVAEFALRKLVEASVMKDGFGCS